MKRILILCTGNSCRSQIAEGFLKSFDNRLEVFSAGTNPALQVHPKAIQVMSKIGIDLSQNHPRKVDQFVSDPFDLSYYFEVQYKKIPLLSTNSYNGLFKSVKEVLRFSHF